MKSKPCQSVLNATSMKVKSLKKIPSYCLKYVNPNQLHIYKLCVNCRRKEFGEMRYD